MAEHYFTVTPSSAHQEVRFTETLVGREMTFTTDAGVFSKSKVDLGSKLLIEALTKYDFSGKELVLDWGCGYGPIGISVAVLLSEKRLDVLGKIDIGQEKQGHVIMVDVNGRAVELAKTNVRANRVTNAEVRQGDGFEAITEVELDMIVCNPPIRAGKQVIYPMVEQSISHLAIGGSLVMVAKTNQGAKSLAKKMEEVFGNVTELEKGSGFRVISSTRRV